PHVVSTRPTPPLARLSPLSRRPPNVARPDPPLPASRRGPSSGSRVASRWSSRRPRFHRLPEETSPQGNLAINQLIMGKARSFKEEKLTRG
uniref:Uncharacterized protein n=2 Tax=Aegilops tauschii subsp. strangulata TaxID=200361 RepID=A0A453DK95_AEGTS